MPAQSHAATAVVTVDVKSPGIPTPPMFYGLMTEEINHTFDGGLYAELIQNRTFQDDANVPAHWSATGNAKIALDHTDPVNAANPFCLRMDLANNAAGGVANDGFWGIPTRPGTDYRVSFYAKSAGGFAGPVSASIIGNDGTEYARGTVEAIDGTWKKYTLTLTTAGGFKPTSSAKFALSAVGPGTVSFNLVSLFPPTYLDTPGGLRADLMEMMADLKPSFIRLPGGNYLEGNTFETRFDWKKQIGPVDLRPGHMGCWDYRSSDGMGLPQMLLWCRQLNAEPVLGLFAGYTLKHDHVTAGPDMQRFVDEAIEEIEYVTGGPETTWGKKRIDDGLVEPLKLTYVEIGNEDWFDRSGSYDGRFTQMFDAIRAKYLNLKIIASAPVSSRTPDLYDDHFYQSPNAMVTDWNHYDRPKNVNATADLHYDSGRFHGTFARGQVPEVFCGEWATQNGKPTPTLRAALADAVWLMGLERNADLIKLQCYAPLLVNVNPNASQWGTNLIGYDAMSAFGSPSYYAQALFGQNKADRQLPIVLESPQIPTPPRQAAHGAVGLGSWRTDVEYKDLTVTAPDGKTLLSADEAIDLKKWTFDNGEWISSEGVLRPAMPGVSWGTIGDVSWQDCTINLKARKNGGNEGFLVLWHAANADTYNWWNIGGWGNTSTQAVIAREGSRLVYGKPSTFTVQTGKWYDLRVEVRGKSVRCYIDGALINEATDPPPLQPPQMLYAGAGYVNASNEVVVKIVNYSTEPVETTLNLNGVASIKPEAKLIVLTGPPGEMNSIESPTRVAPKEETITDAAATMKRTFPPCSLSLLRLKIARGE